MKRTGLLIFSLLTLVYLLRPPAPTSAQSTGPPQPESPALKLASPAASTKVFLPTIIQAPAAATVQVLCDGQVFDGYAKRPFSLGASPSDQDPNVQKVIRNCVFRNGSVSPILIRAAKNVLIEGSTFENIRTHIPGDGVHAISLACYSTFGCSASNPIDNVVIRGNTFRSIGADGVQVGEQARYISNVYIQNNEFVGGADVGENAIDVKGVEGPIYITGNRVHGFRPCEGPLSNPPGSQDCSGAPGAGVTLHEGGATRTSPSNVTIENNDLYDNVYGLSLRLGLRSITVRGNRISNNLSTGILVDSVYSLVVTGNTLSNNPTQIHVTNSPLPGGSCTINNNTLAGSTAVSPSGCN